MRARKQARGSRPMKQRRRQAACSAVLSNLANAKIAIVACSMQRPGLVAGA